MDANQIDFPVKGMSEQQAEAILKTKKQKKVMTDMMEYEVIETEDSAITAFCKEGRIKSVRIQAPFLGNVRGVHIGDSEGDVLRILGEPLRIWKMTLDKEGWFYDDEAFMRVDFSIELGNRVKMIYV